MPFSCHSVNKKKLHFELYPYRQFDDKPKLSFLEGPEKKDFFENIQKLNEVIGSPEKLQKKWNDYLEKTGKKYLTYIEVPNNRYIRGARYYRLIPGFLTKRHKALILNLMRCESHREIMKASLEKNISR